LALGALDFSFSKVKVEPLHRSLHDWGPYDARGLAFEAAASSVREMGDAMPEQPRHPRWATGTPVLVRNRFDGQWVAGFELAGVKEQAYEVRRRSDHVVLPARFDQSEVRPEGETL